MKMNTIDWIAFILVIIGALNWGLVGIFDFNLVTTIFGDTTTLTRIVYILVGVSGLYLILTSGKMTKSV